ncbi:MAG: efflux RND transporter permease subunit [Alistipes sp.]
MLNKIINFSLHNRLLVMIAGVVLLAVGTFTARHMEVDVFPDLNAPTVVVMTEANGMAAEEVERTVTFPIETAVNGATDVRRVRSSSTTGFSVVWVEFDWGTDIYRARQIVSEKLATLSETLPQNVGTPTLEAAVVDPRRTADRRTDGDTTSLQELRTLADWVIRPRLLATGGVAQVTVIGGDIKEYQVLLDPARMRHYDVSMQQVLDVVADLSRNSSGGILNQYGNEYIIRGVLSTADEQELGKLSLRRRTAFRCCLKTLRM